MIKGRFGRLAVGLSPAGQIAGPQLQAMTPKLVPHRIIPEQVKKRTTLRIHQHVGCKSCDIYGQSAVTTVTLLENLA